MTRYEVGFLTKCAEYGLDTGTGLGLMDAVKEAKCSDTACGRIDNDVKKSYRKNKAEYDRSVEKSKTSGKGWFRRQVDKEVASAKAVGGIAKDTARSVDREVKGALKKKAQAVSYDLGLGGLKRPRGIKIGDLRADAIVGKGGGAVGVGNPKRGGLLLAGTMDGATRQNALAGAGLGALIGVLRARRKKQNLKEILRKALVGAAIGGGAGTLGTMITSAPGVVDKARDVISGGLGKAKDAVQK